MLTESKIWYRTEYLHSDHWQNLRIARMAKDHGRCQLCGVEAFTNDVHHLNYRGSVYHVTIADLVTLCRECHEAVHKTQQLKGKVTDKNSEKRWFLTVLNVARCGLLPARPHENTHQALFSMTKQVLSRLGLIDPKLFVWSWEMTALGEYLSRPTLFLEKYIALTGKDPRPKRLQQTAFKQLECPKRIWRRYPKRLKRLNKRGAKSVPATILLCDSLFYNARFEAYGLWSIWYKLNENDGRNN